MSLTRLSIAFGPTMIPTESKSLPIPPNTHIVQTRSRFGLNNHVFILHCI